MREITIEDLLKAGVHFGHLTSRWNPKMKPFIFMERNGIHIIDLRQTLELLKQAGEAAREIAARGEQILFVGTKKQARDIVKREAERCGMPYVVERWLGGTLTNFQTIRQSIRRMEDLKRMEEEGTFEQLKKKERLRLRREREKLERYLGGIAHMTRLPGALYVVDVVREHIAVKEARKLHIPIIAMVDTNADPELIDYPIPANDDAVKSIQLITSYIADAILEGLAEREARKAEAEAQTAEAQAAAEERQKEKEESAA